MIKKIVCLLIMFITAVSPVYAEGSAYDGLSFKPGVQVIENVNYKADEAKRKIKTKDTRLKSLTAGTIVVMKGGSGDKAIKILKCTEKKGTITISYVVPAIGDMVSTSKTENKQKTDQREEKKQINQKRQKLEKKAEVNKNLTKSINIAQYILVGSLILMALILIIWKK